MNTIQQHTDTDALRALATIFAPAAAQLLLDAAAEIEALRASNSLLLMTAVKAREVLK